MPCEFLTEGGNQAGAACNRNEAIPHLIQVQEMKEAFTPAQVLKDVCMNPNPEAQTQCDVHADLEAYGRGSQWCK